jgi:hypothetical protein
MSPVHWLLAPLALPVFCNRCITAFYVPTFIVAINFVGTTAGKCVHFITARHSDDRSQASV